MALDEKRGLVFASTGSASFDFYGANRAGDNLFANCVLALKAETGERVWHFQAVRHDVWDRDFPAPPALVTVQPRRARRSMPSPRSPSPATSSFSIARPASRSFPSSTARSHRRRGRRSARRHAAAAAEAGAVRPPAAHRGHAHQRARRRPTRRAGAVPRDAQQRAVRRRPAGKEPSSSPASTAAASGAARPSIPTTGLLYVNANEMAWILRLVERPRRGATASGQSLYHANCAGCHRAGPQRHAAGVSVAGGAGRDAARRGCGAVIRRGAGRMPGFRTLGDPASTPSLAYS